MITNKKVNVSLNEKEHKILVHFEVFDELTPEQLLANHDNLEKEIEKMKDDLAKVDTQAVKIKEDLTKGLKEQMPILEGLGQAVQKAKLWAELNKKLSERKGEEAKK